jgi:hypothetical protein
MPVRDLYPRAKQRQQVYPAEYKTENVYVAAYLLAKGFKLYEHENYTITDDGRIAFNFSGSEVEECSSKYFAGDSIPAIEYVTALCRLRAKMAEVLRGRGNR